MHNLVIATYDRPFIIGYKIDLEELLQEKAIQVKRSYPCMEFKKAGLMVHCLRQGGYAHGHSMDNVSYYIDPSFLETNRNDVYSLKDFLTTRYNAAEYFDLSSYAYSLFKAPCLTAMYFIISGDRRNRKILLHETENGLSAPHVILPDNTPYSELSNAMNSALQARVEASTWEFFSLLHVDDIDVIVMRTFDNRILANTQEVTAMSVTSGFMSRSYLYALTKSY